MVENEVVNAIDEYGLAQFGVKPFEKTYAIGTSEVLGNRRLAHEQIFFEKGGSTGFASDGPAFGYDWGQEYKSKYADPKDYIFDNIHYDDHVIRVAIKNVGYRHRYNVLNMRGGSTAKSGHT